MKTAVKSPTTVINPDVTKRFVYFVDNYIKETQQDISKKTGLTQAHISYMLNGKRGIGFEVSKLFMKHYNLNVEWLATGDPTKHPVSKKTTETGGMMGKTIKEQAAEIMELKSALKEMEQAIMILEANQGAFIKRIEHFMEVMQRK